MAIQGDLVGAVSTSKLPGELLVQILARLPVKSIIRFKSVCRVWHVLFNSPIFIQHHSSFKSSSFAKTTTNLSSLLVHTPWPKSNARIFSLLLDRSCGNPILIDLNPPFEGDLEYVEVVGSINGLVCLNLCKNATSIVLWNPATRKRSNIPNPPHSNFIVGGDGDGYASLGFAYDETIESYKVIRILYASYELAYGADGPVRVEIYNTVTNTWRTIELASFPLLINNLVDVVNGVPYWFGMGYEMGNESNQFVWFDASAEAFRFHPIPPDDYDDNHGRWYGAYDGLKVTGEHPVLVYCAKHLVPNNKFCKITRLEIIKLKKCDVEGGNSSSIDKLTIVPVPHLWKIVGFWRNGEIIALDQYNALVTYDIHSTQVRYLPSHNFYGNHCCPEVYDYTESLVWPTSLG